MSIDNNRIKKLAKTLTEKVMSSSDPMKALSDLLEQLHDLETPESQDLDEALEAASTATYRVAIQIALLKISEDIVPRKFFVQKLHEITREFYQLPFLAVAKINPLIPKNLELLFRKTYAEELKDLPESMAGLLCMLSYLASAQRCGEDHNIHGVGHHDTSMSDIESAQQEDWGEIMKAAEEKRELLRVFMGEDGD